MASAEECTSAQLGARSAALSADLEAMKTAIMSSIDSKLSQNEESMWKRGLKEIKRLQSEQQEVLTVVSGLQEKQEALATENQQLRTALCEVTSKFELVVNEMRQALRQLPQGGSHHGQLSPSPSAASTAASDAAGAGGLLHSAELAQGRVHVGHLERALQRYKQLPETFEEAWVKLFSIGDKARLVSELNILVENRLKVWGNFEDTRDEYRTLLAQYEDAIRKLQRAALLVLETQNVKRSAQDESFTEPTPSTDAGQGSASMTLGLTPTWPTCAPEDTPAGGQGAASMALGLTPTWPTCASEEATEAFCTPPRASMSSEDQVLLSEACWQTWQGHYAPSPGFPGLAATAAAVAALGASPVPMGGSAAVLSLESALTAAPGGYPSPAAAQGATPPSKVAAVASGGLKQLQLAECLDELRPGEVGAAAAPAQAQQAPARSPWPEASGQFATPPVGVFKVELHKEHKKMPLGMEVNEVDKALRVQSIDENGLAGRYNMAQSSESSMLRVGDLILDVNGVHGEPSGMLQECKAQQQLRLSVARGAAASPAGAALSPPGASSTGLDAASAGGSGAGIAPRGGADSSELERVLAEVAAPPVSWGRLRPEARVFVPSSAQASEKQTPAGSPDSQRPGPQAPASDAAPEPASAPSSPGGAEGAAVGEDEVVKKLFP